MPAWRWVAGAAALAVAVQLYGVYRVTGPPSAPLFPNVDKVEHLVGFAGPVVLVLVAVLLRQRAHGRPVTRRPVVVVSALFLVHAVVSEIIQHVFLPNRSGDPLDVLADTAGVGVGVLGYGVVRRRLARGAGRP